MKKFIPALLAVALLVGGLWYFGTSEPSHNVPTAKSPDAAKTGNTNPAGNDVAANSSDQPGTDAGSDTDNFDVAGNDVELPEQKPATQVYKNADDALKAVRAAAKDYDDLVLEQFTNIGEDCAWCDGFFKSVKDIMMAPETSKEERGYFAELLAVSGRLSNVQTLVEAIKGTTDSALIDTYSEALELTYGKDKDDIVNYLGTQLGAGNDRLKEASIAAITNQGSPLAADLLYKHTVEAGDPDGYYSLGIGLGEFVPDEKTTPFLQELASKRDQYSHLAVKALLNGGLPGLKVVFDVLKNSSDVDFDRKMLQGAVDHVSFEEGVEEFVKSEIEHSTKPTIKEFGDQILKELAGSEADDGSELAVATPPMTPLQ